MDTDFNKLPSDIPTIAIVAGRLEINGLPVDDEDLVIEIAKALDINVVKWIGRAAFKQKPGNSAGMRIEFENILTHQQPYAIFNVSTERASNTQYGKKGTSLPPGKFALLPSHHLAKLYTSCGLTFRRMSTAHRDINKLKGRYFTYSAMKGSKIVASMLRHLSLSADDLSPEFLTVLPWRNRPNFVPISNGFTMEKPSQSRPNLVPISSQSRPNLVPISSQPNPAAQSQQGLQTDSAAIQDTPYKNIRYRIQEPIPYHPDETTEQNEQENIIAYTDYAEGGPHD